MEFSVRERFFISVVTVSGVKNFRAELQLLEDLMGSDVEPAMRCSATVNATYQHTS